jgi:hypothetical protein
MLAAQWLPCHAIDTEGLTIQVSSAGKFLDYLLQFGIGHWFGAVARVDCNSAEEIIGTEHEHQSEREICQRISGSV